jgi:hypothetical protein
MHFLHHKAFFLLLRLTVTSGIHLNEILSSSLYRSNPHRTTTTAAIIKHVRNGQFGHIYENILRHAVSGVIHKRNTRFPGLYLNKLRHRLWDDSTIFSAVPEVRVKIGLMYSNVYNFLWWFGLLKFIGTDIFGEKLAQKQHPYYFDFVDFPFTIFTITNTQCSWFG